MEFPLEITIGPHPRADRAGASRHVLVTRLFRSVAMMRAVVRDLRQAMVDPVALGLVMGMVPLCAQVMLLMVQRIAMGAVIGTDRGNREREQSKGQETDQ